MRRSIVLAMLISAVMAHAQTADDIINKHYEATGGREKWSHVTAMKMTGNYVMGPAMLAPVTRVVSIKTAPSLYSDFTWQGMTAKTVVHGDSGSRYEPFGGKRETDPLSPNELRDEKLSVDPRELLFSYKEKGYTVEYLGTDDMDGSDVYKLRLTTTDGDMIYYYIDADTYYILQITKRIRFKDKEEKSSTTYSDFRKTDFGVTVPFSNQQVDENGAEQGGPVTYTKVEVNPAVEPSLFETIKITK